MKNASLSVAVSVLALSVFFSSTVLSAPLRCHVIEHSDTGGTVEVLTDENPAPSWFPEGNQPQILWEPAPAPLSPRLTLAFFNSTLAQMGKVPKGGHIRFHVSAPAGPDDTQVIIDLPAAEPMVFERGQLQYGYDFGSDDETQPAMDIMFATDEAHWSPIKNAILSKGRLNVKLVRKGKILSQAMFDFGNLDARDALLAKAAQRVAAADPKVCTTAAPPVIDMTPRRSTP